ncbi:hypothetical protein DY000_02021704 [Brassica cretica]|uniref:Uncharacterized protein n=1 Tax=Brassica cretica TaxID=69181 RepID=A0ABQ7EMM5_BRACR|nr:hypothetical protein DY000_02021704 [Brassica cretica]
MKDFLELEEFLELEDGEKLEDLDSGGEVTMEDFLELEEWLEDMDQNSKKKLDDNQHTSRGDLETSKASIDRHQPDEIDRHPHSIIDRHPPEIVDRYPSLDELPGNIVELEPVEESVHESEASCNVDSKHLRPLIWTEQADEFHKRVKRIHDPVKFVVPCAIFEVDSPIPPDKGVHLSSYIEVLDDHQHVEASQRGLQFRDEVDKGPAKPVSIATDRIPSIDTNKHASIDTTTSPSINTTPSPSIDTTTSSSLYTGHVSEQKEFSVCVNLWDGDTTTRSDKSGGKKRRNWKKRKGIKDSSQYSLIPHFSNGVRKSRVRNRCFSQPFAKLRALIIAEMIDKGEEGTVASIDTVARESIDTVARKSIDTVAKNRELL